MPERMSRRRRANAAPGIAVTSLRTIPGPGSGLGGLCIATTSSHTRRAVVLQRLAPAEPGCAPVPAGRHFTIFEAELPAFLAGLAEARDALNAPPSSPGDA